MKLKKQILCKKNKIVKTHIRTKREITLTYNLLFTDFKSSHSIIKKYTCITSKHTTLYSEYFHHSFFLHLIYASYLQGIWFM